MITTSPVLKYYDPNKPTRISSDASQEGLGAVLEQQQHNDEWHPISFASRSLNPAERNYSPLERETLSIVFACEKFREYIYGLSFHIYNDHQPLKSISPNHYPEHQQEFNAFYSASKDTTSLYTTRKDRKCLSQTLLVEHHSQTLLQKYRYLDLMPSYIQSSRTNLSNKRLLQFQNETLVDPTLQKLTEYINKDWPDRQNTHHLAQPYYNIRDELSINSGLILKGNRIIVPQSMQKEIMKSLHIGHPGITKVKSRTRTTVYWPGINNQLDDLSRTCHQCQEFQNRQPSEEPLHHEVPDTPWTKVATDLFHLFKKTYLLVLDYTTNFFEISELPNVESPTVIKHMKSILARYGIPKEISDNGPEYSAKAFQSFCNDWDIHHTASSPEYPKSNGLAERTIQTVKRTLKKAHKAGDDINLTL